MNNFKIFDNAKFGQIRTVESEDKIYFVATDIARALGYENTSKAISDHWRWVTKRYIPHPQNPEKDIEVNVIPEGDMYRLISQSKLENAEKFEAWVFDEVLPELRKTGYYGTQNMSRELQAIIMIDRKQVKMEERMDKLEFEIPLYGAEADELSSHVKRKGVKVLGGKQSEAYKDAEIRSKVYRDIYDQIRREFGLYDNSGRAMSYKALKRKYIADAHELVDCYEAPTYLAELIEAANAQMRLGVA